MSATETELRQLRSRVRALEDQLDEERGRRRRDDSVGEPASGDWSDFGERKVDELSRFFSGTVRATLEGFRVAADAASYFVEDVLERNVPERGESPSEVAQRLPTDITRGVARSLDRALDIPGRAVDRFNRTYHSDEGGTTSGQRGRTSGQRGRSTSTREQQRTGALTGEVRDDYESWTKTELYERATGLGVEGRSEMTKDELIAAIRDTQPDLEDWSKADLYQRARELEIEGRSDMNREELIAAIRSRQA